MAIFITGGTGYVGRPLVEALVARGHAVRALVRPGSERKLPAGAESVPGDALNGDTFETAVQRGDTFVQLVGTPHPGPRKGPEFRRVDLVSVQQSVRVAADRGVSHFVYMSVAHPAPVMHEYIAVRTAGERLIRDSGLNANILRPWYVLGPGHRWPYLLIPFYWIGELVPSAREGARRLGLVTLNQMVCALVGSVENPGTGFTIVEVPGIRFFASRFTKQAPHKS